MNPLLLNVQLIPTYDLFSIGFADTSYYPDGYVITSSSFEITPPGFVKVNLPFTEQQVNIYRSVDLDLSCDGEALQPLPDGVYTVKYSIYPYSSNFVEKSFFRFDILLCEFEKHFLDVDVSDCNCSGVIKERNKRKLREVRAMFESIIAASNHCDFDKASKLYKFIQKTLHNLESCDCD